jgi:hypothetical protein
MLLTKWVRARFVIGLWAVKFARKIIELNSIIMTTTINNLLRTTPTVGQCLGKESKSVPATRIFVTPVIGSLTHSAGSPSPLEKVLQASQWRRQQRPITIAPRLTAKMVQVKSLLFQQYNYCYRTRSFGLLLLNRIIKMFTEFCLEKSEAFKQKRETKCDKNIRINIKEVNFEVGR